MAIDAEIDWRLLASLTLNGLSLAALYFIVASGFSLVFGLMRVVNLAYGSLYLLGAYIGYEVGAWSSSWSMALLAGIGVAALLGALLQIVFFGWMQGQELRQALVAIGISIVLGDLMLAHWGGDTYQIDVPAALSSFITLPLVGRYPTARLALIVIALLLCLGLWLALERTRLGSLVRAGVDDRAMLEATGIDVALLSVGVSLLAGALAGGAGVVGGTVLSIAPGEDARYLLSSLIVVIVGGMGNVLGAALGAVLVGLAETYGLAYAPTYSAVFSFIIMVAVLAIRPRGLLAGTAP
jgi:branched-chain amino acid transport system permease protein